MTKVEGGRRRSTLGRGKAEAAHDERTGNVTVRSDKPRLSLRPTFFFCNQLLFFTLLLLCLYRSGVFMFFSHLPAMGYGGHGDDETRSEARVGLVGVGEGGVKVTVKFFFPPPPRRPPPALAPGVCSGKEESAESVRKENKGKRRGEVSRMLVVLKTPVLFFLLIRHSRVTCRSVGGWA